MEKLLLIDGNSILNRAFYGVPDLTNSEGIHTNAVYGFLNIMLKVIDEEQATDLVVAFDLKAPTFRHNVYAEYKGTRKPMPEELRQQLPVIKEVLQAMNITIVEMEGYEADDILGTLGKAYEKKGYKVAILSGDRDLLQLASDNIMIRIPKTKGGMTEVENYNTADVVAKYGVTPEEFIEVKALMGDASDNIKGAPGIGEKTAVAIISAYHTIENAYRHIDEVTPKRAQNSLRESKDILELSKFLVTINTKVPVSMDSVDSKIGELYTSKAFDIFARLGFKSLLKRFDKEAASDAAFDVNKSAKRVEDFDEVCAVLAKAAKASLTGIHCVSLNGELGGVALCFGQEDIYYIPVMLFVTEDFLCDELSKLCKTANTVFCGLKEQLYFIPEYDKSKMFDVSLAAYLINPLKEKYTPEDYLGQFLQETIVPYAKNAEADSVAYAYAAYKAKDILADKLKSEEMYSLYENIEYPLTFVLYDMQREGIRVDRQALAEYGSRLKVKIDELEGSIYGIAGESFNINSPKQLGEILFDKLHLQNGKKTKTGYSTSAEVLEKLTDAHPIVPAVLEYRQLTKLYSTYAEGLSVYICDDERIHGKFNQTITATGRISSTEPNLQNIPVRMELGRLIRKVFIPKEGCVFVDADYSQVELRIMAHMSGDETLISAYNDAKDIHAITASQVFDTPLEKVTGEQRRNAKAVNFGIIYGISSFGLSQDLSISRKEANEYINRYFETYPKVKEYLDKAVEEAKQNGYSVTLYGRRRPIPELKSGNFMTRSFGERVAMNSPIQGTAADIMKIAMINVHNRLKNEGLKSKMILQIHDELLIEAAKDEADRVKLILEEEMKNAADLKVRLEVDAHTGNDWFEVK